MKKIRILRVFTSAGLVMFGLFAGVGCAPPMMIVSNASRSSPDFPRVYAVPAGLSVAYLVESDAGLILVDAGSPGHTDAIVRAMQRIGRTDVKLIFITHAHFDHYGCAAEIRRQTGAPIAIHAADAEALSRGQTPLGLTRSWGRLGKLALPLAERVWPPEPTTPDIVVQDGHVFEGFDCEVRVVHTPGHSAGSSSLLVNKELVFVGDLISSRPWRFVQCYYASNWDEIATSAQRVAQLQAAQIFPGHGPPISGDDLNALVQTAR